VYIIGKVSAGGAFQKLPRLQRGDRVVLRTRAGALTYTVRGIDDKPARGLTRDPGFSRRVEGRLVLVGIRYRSGDERTGRILVVTAQLTGARSG
jgi:hypothetical protein